MCDKEKYNKIYKELNELTPEDTLELILETEDKEEQAFYAVLGNYLLQKKQKVAIEGNLF